MRFHPNITEILLFGEIWQKIGMEESSFFLVQFKQLLVGNTIDR
jgi:hypothetical protein